MRLGELSRSGLRETVQIGGGRGANVCSTDDAGVATEFNHGFGWFAFL